MKAITFALSLILPGSVLVSAADYRKLMDSVDKQKAMVC
jgi:hypothetical protein